MPRNIAISENFHFDAGISLASCVYTNIYRGMYRRDGKEHASYNPISGVGLGSKVGPSAEGLGFSFADFEGFEGYV